MAKRKCKPVEEWKQLHLWPESEAEIRRRTFIADMKQLPRWKDWHPKEFRAGVSTNP